MRHRSLIPWAYWQLSTCRLRSPSWNQETPSRYDFSHLEPETICNSQVAVELWYIVVMQVEVSMEIFLICVDLFNLAGSWSPQCIWHSGYWLCCKSPWWGGERSLYYFGGDYFPTISIVLCSLFFGHRVGTLASSLFVYLWYIDEIPKNLRIVHFPHPCRYLSRNCWCWLKWRLKEGRVREQTQCTKGSKKLTLSTFMNVFVTPIRNSECAGYYQHIWSSHFWNAWRHCSCRECCYFHYPLLAG